MKQLKKYDVYRNPITNQFIFKSGITGRTCYGTDWTNEYKGREELKNETADSESIKNKERQQNKDIETDNNLNNTYNSNGDTNINLVKK